VTSYRDDDDLQSSHLNAALWRPMLAHARPYWLSFLGLASAGLAVATCDILLPRVTGAVIDSAVGGTGERLGIYGGYYLALVILLALARISQRFR
jgi:hypothetical protein